MIPPVMFLWGWGAALLPAVVFALLLLIPGALVLAAFGARWLRSLVFAPVVSIALAGLGGVVLNRIGIRWGIGSFALLSLLVVVVIMVVRTAVTRHPPWRRPPIGAAAPTVRPLVPFVAAGAVISAIAVGVQYLRPIGAAENITYNYDAVWHYDVIRHILITGDASSLDVGLLDGTAGSHYYPAAWHSLVALTMDATGASLPAAVNASIFVLFAFVWPLSAGVLAVRLFGPSRLVVLGTIASAPLFAAFPTHFLDFGPLYSNLFSFAFAPLCLAVFVELLQRDRWRRGRWRGGLGAATVVVVATFIAMLFAQPNSLFTLFVIVLPLGYVLILRSTGERFPRHRWVPWLAAVVFTVIWVTAWVLVHDSAPLTRTVSVDWPAPNSAAQAFGEFVLQGTQGSFPQFVLVVLVTIGVVAAVRRRGTRWVVVAYGLLGLLYVLDDGNGGGPHSLRDYATGFWYHDSVRLAATIVLLAAPLAGLGFREILMFAAARFPNRTPSVRWRPAAAIIVALLVMVVSVLGDHALAVRRAALHDSAVIDGYQMLNPEKVAFLKEVAALVPNGVRIANDPDDGSGFAYSMFSLPVTFPALPGNWLGAATPDQMLILDRLNTLATDPTVCAVVRREHLGYVLALSAPHTPTTPRTPIGYSADFWRGVRVDATTPGFDRVLHRGDMALYEITGCG